MEIVGGGHVASQMGGEINVWHRNMQWFILIRSKRSVRLETWVGEGRECGFEIYDGGGSGSLGNYLCLVTSWLKLS